MLGTIPENSRRFNDSPITVSGSDPKAQMNWAPLGTGTWNLQKLHLELKYLGRKERDSARLRNHVEGEMAKASLVSLLKRAVTMGDGTHLDCLFFLTSSSAKMWTVP